EAPAKVRGRPDPVDRWRAAPRETRMMRQHQHRQHRNQQHQQRRNQQGMTFIGLLCVLALVGIIGYAGVRLVPVYLNYLKIARAMDSAATEVKGDNPDPNALRNILERHWE